MLIRPHLVGVTTADNCWHLLVGFNAYSIVTEVGGFHSVASFSASRCCFLV